MSQQPTTPRQPVRLPPTAPDGSRWRRCHECGELSEHSFYRPAFDGDVDPGATCYNPACRASY